VILAAPNRYHFFTHHSFNQSRKIFIILVPKSQLSIIVAATGIKLLVVGACENRMVITAANDGNEFSVKRIDELRDVQ